MTDAEIARPLEQELQELFGEDSCQLERRPCTGKYRGHTDYTLVFGSGRRLYVGLDQRNYLNGLHDHLRAIYEQMLMLPNSDTPICGSSRPSVWLRSKTWAILKRFGAIFTLSVRGFPSGPKSVCPVSGSIFSRSSEARKLQGAKIIMPFSPFFT